MVNAGHNHRISVNAAQHRFAPDALNMFRAARDAVYKFGLVAK